MAWLRPSTKASIPPFPPGAGQVGGGTAPVAGGAFLDWIGPNPNALYPEPDFLTAADVGFTRNELVYACIMEKATSLPDASFRVYGADGQGEARESHPLRRLMATPNPSMTEFELLELTSIYMDLAGIAFWEVVLDRLDQPAELWPLRPDNVRIWPQRNGRTTYGYVIGGGRVVPLGENVLAFKYPNPTTPALGQAPMRGANRAVALDNEATDFVKALLQNRAVPGTVIETEQRIDEDLTDRLTAKWLDRFGRQNRGAPAFLQKGMKVHSLGLDLGQLEFPDLRTISESRICMSFGVPPILVGAKVGLDRSTFANYAEARRSLWEETLLPLQKRIQQVVVAKLMPMVETGPRPRRSTARFDNSEVLALRESEANRWEKGTNALRAGGLTLNQFYRYVGMPTIGAQGDVYLRPAGIVPTDAIGNVLAERPVTSLTAGPAPAAAAGGGTTGTARKLEPLPAAKAAVRVMTRAIGEAAARQAGVVLDQVDDALALLTVAPEKWDVQRDRLWDTKRWEVDLMTVMEPHMRQAAVAAARSVGDAPVGPLMGYISAAAQNEATRWTATTRTELDAALVLGGPDVRDNVEAVFERAKGGRAEQLARGVVTEMVGFAKVDTAKRLGFARKTWAADAESDDHAPLDGETVPVGEAFSNGEKWPRGATCTCDVRITEG